jgi:hypothetical protein
MQLHRVRLVDVGPFEDVVFPFADEDGSPRRVTVVHGGGGVGKTTLIAAIALTRPGHALAPSGLTGSGERPPEAGGESTRSARVECDWLLGQDDPDRPHPLAVHSPTTTRSEDELEIFRRREQALFDRRARDGGYAFLTIPSTRWFSRQPVTLSAPARSVARYDVRTQAPLDDGSRSDLTRETKQALAYASIAHALADAGGDRGRNLDLLGRAMTSAVDRLVSLAGLSYVGLDAATFEPTFATSDGRSLSFDALPTRARHLVAFAALSVRVLWSAYPGRDPRQSEGVIAIDEIDAHQDPAIQATIVAALVDALPAVQWIVTTTSPVVAGSSDTRDVLALRRLPRTTRVELYLGSEARTH